MRKTLSTTTVARLLGVAVGSVANWIDSDQLKAGRTPGGHRRVAVEDLIEFLKRQNLPIPAELVAGSPRILVVDDEVAVTHLIAETIKTERPDHEVLEAHDGFSAGEMVGSWAPHVVVLDLRMPDIDGFEVCRRIKSRESTRNIAVIAVTADRSEEAARRILECGARVCLAKPLSMAHLLGEIDRALDEAPAAL
ncbi:MAG: Chemotaxis response regulator protein-glutamate methylesterase [Phycisphaerae bacterium]|nr:Chemotaxis response regulator protein-glutamate methylesterase [Phycisphaerae bacterium]